LNEAISTSTEARRLLNCESAGVLSTISVDVEGYPFGSVVPYCLDRQGRPLILISRIAQHHKNLLADPRCSLIVLDRSVEDVQMNGRLTCVADAMRLDGAQADEIGARYYRHFPQSMDFHKIHDFEFFVLQPKRFRYIGGFGRIHWLDPTKLLRSNPFSEADEQSMAEHMNADHVDAMRGYCRLAGIDIAKGTTPAFVGADAEGFHLRAGGSIVRFDLETEAQTGEQVRAELVKLARRAREQ
jgi:putative heme iron utilization protein